MKPSGDAGVFEMRKPKNNNKDENKKKKGRRNDDVEEKESKVDPEVHNFKVSY